SQRLQSRIAEERIVAEIEKMLKLFIATKSWYASGRHGVDERTVIRVHVSLRLARKERDELCRRDNQLGFGLENDGRRLARRRHGGDLRPRWHKTVNDAALNQRESERRARGLRRKLRSADHVEERQQIFLRHLIQS